MCGNSRTSRIDGELVNNMTYNVVYGDTDSIFVNSRTRDLQQAIEVGRQIKKEVNKQYRKLQIGIDGMFNKLLLLKKKKQ